MIFIHAAKFTCEEIEDRIEEEAKVYSLMLKKHFPFSKNLPENGYAIKEHASVFEFCDPSVAAKLLNTQPSLNVLMPCRISVYEKDGSSFVSTLDLSAILESLECEDDLKAEILALYDKMRLLIKRF
ncbi:DUF302 domain-containing protein [Sulfurovum sp.]|uniref:DUF302 domain-containing protein n=1 Tax=Sulfurovum sp. TaxID=1969726 RepID=UPI0035661B91